MGQLFGSTRGWQGKALLVWIVVLGMLCLLALLPCIGFLPGVVAAEEQGSISGIVQHNGQSISEHRIMLIRFGPGGEVQRTPSQTDTQGHFVFDNLETGNTFEYVVGIRYAGQLYRSESVRLLAGQQRTGMVVEVEAPEAQATAEPETQSALQIANHLIVIVLRDDHLEVREIVRLLNNGSIPYNGAIVSGSGYSFHIPLPYGYYNLTDIQGLPPERCENQIPDHE